MAGAGQRLVLEQRRFDAEGFASTIWDSAIVLARYLEHRCSARSAHSAAAAAAGTAAAAGPPPYSGGPLAGASAVELGAGCGLVACVASALGAAVVATDLEANLALLRRNLERNATPGRPPAAAAALRWGGPAAARLLRAELGGAAPSLLLASDVMYIADAVPDLVATLVALCDRTTEVLLAHGRNRPAEDSFLRIAGTRFAVAVVPDEDLHPVYQCLDVTVLRLRLRPGGGEGSAGE